MRPAIVALAVLAACGPQTPTTVAVYAPAAHETRQDALAEQRDATRVEERASRSRRSVSTTTTTTARRAEPPMGNTAGIHSRKYSTQAVMPAGGCGPGKKPRALMVACWTPLVTQYPWPNLNKVWTVMACESQGDPAATGPATRYGHAHGLLQLMNGPYDPAQNIAAAWTKSRHGTNWRPWDCR